MPCRLILILGLIFSARPLWAQLRVEPESPRPAGTPLAEPWANVRDSFRRAFEFPVWPIPTDLSSWKNIRRQQTLDTAIELLGDLPPRPSPSRVKITKTEDRGNHTAEYFELDNGFDMVITGLLLRPEKLPRPAPAIVVMHGWSGDKDNLLTRVGPYDELVGPMLVEQGYVVAAIDGYFHGDRIGKGPNDTRDLETVSQSRIKQKQQQSLFAINLWYGRTLWGMMIREQLCLVDYIETRPDVDARRIGATGMSLGNTTGFWLTAVDRRIKAFVGVCCFTRIEQLIQQGFVQYHGLYYFVPGMLKHFDTEAVFSLIAPRPMLQLNGDGDTTCPVDGIEILEQKLGSVYEMHGRADCFQSVVYTNTGHVYLPDMKQRMLAWFTRHLPPTR